MAEMKKNIIPTEIKIKNANGKWDRYTLATQFLSTIVGTKSPQNALEYYTSRNSKLSLNTVRILGSQFITPAEARRFAAGYNIIKRNR